MINFWKEFCKKLCLKWIFLQNNSVENSLICPRAKSSNHCLTELFSIYQNKHWTIRWRDNHIVVPSSNRIKSKIDWILESSIIQTFKYNVKKNLTPFFSLRPSYVYFLHCLCTLLKIHFFRNSNTRSWRIWPHHLP